MKGPIVEIESEIKIAVRDTLDKLLSIVSDESTGSKENIERSKSISFTKRNIWQSKIQIAAPSSGKTKRQSGPLIFSLYSLVLGCTGGASVLIDEMSRFYKRGLFHYSGC